MKSDKESNDTDYSLNRYGKLVVSIFRSGYTKGSREFFFQRSDMEIAAESLGISLPKNLGDIVYSFRYRYPLPAEITDTQPKGMEWIIEGAGKARYVFRLVPVNRIVPRNDLAETKIPDSTPEIIGAHSLSDEQALLARVRYNLLVGTFLGVTAYSLQNHLRTTVSGIGQIEIDEVYLAVDKFGRQFIIPVQAKGGHDRHGVVQTLQDIAWCRAKFPELICRPVSVQFLSSDKIAMFELMEQDGTVKVVEERHYRLVPAHDISHDELQWYAFHAH